MKSNDGKADFKIYPAEDSNAKWVSLSRLGDFNNVRREVNRIHSF